MEEHLVGVTVRSEVPGEAGGEGGLSGTDRACVCAVLELVTRDGVGPLPSERRAQEPDHAAPALYDLLCARDSCSPWGAAIAGLRGRRSGRGALYPCGGFSEPPPGRGPQDRTGGRAGVSDREHVW